eukprot:1523239-Prymnesium_polylepis.1
MSTRFARLTLSSQLAAAARLQSTMVQRQQAVSSSSSQNAVQRKNMKRMSWRAVAPAGNGTRAWAPPASIREARTQLDAPKLMMAAAAGAEESR